MPLKSLHRLLLLIAMIGALASLTRAQSATSPAEVPVKRIVFLAGKPSHGPGMHEYTAGCLLLAKALNEQSGLPVKAEVLTAWPDDAATFKDAAAIVIYDSGTKLIGKHMEQLNTLAQTGMGLMFLHYAVHPSPKDGAAYYQPWIGGAFETGFSVNPFWVANMQLLPEHAVSRGISGPVRAHDEFYYNIRFRPDRSKVLNLATATPTRENIVAVNNLWSPEGFDGLGKSQTLMWGVERPDGGRGIGFTGGHFHHNWAIDDYRKLVLNAVVWVAGMEVPSGGVRSLPLTEDDLNANLADKGGTKRRITLPQPDDLAQLKHQPVPTPAEHQARLALQKQNQQTDRGRTRSRDKGKSQETGNSPSTPAKSENITTPASPVDSTQTAVPVSAFIVPDGLEVTAWATSPMLMNPTNMDTDRAGRVWVAEGVNYRKKNHRRPGGDRIVVLEDADHDGTAEQSHVFVQDPELVSPLGIAVLGNQVVVSQPPHLIVYTDVDGDRRFDPSKDKRTNLLSGFLGANHDHSLHAVVAGPDGRWHLNHGNTGAQFTTRDGISYKVGGPYAGGAALAGQRSDDGRIWTGGFAASMNPDGTALRMLGHGFRNSYEHCVTSFGDIYQSDNDDPPACRNTWLMEGGFMGFFSRSGNRLWQADRRRGQSIPVAHWRQEDPGTLPPGDVYGRGSPTGVAYYENGALPEKYQGMFLSADARLQVIYGYFPTAEGAGKKLERFEFLKIREGSHFRPSDVMVGADGAIYVADWFDERVGGHGTQDESFSGGIYRIAPKGFRPKTAVPGVSPAPALSAQEASALLRSPAPNVRYEGLVALREMASSQTTKVRQELDTLLKDPNIHLRARAIWLLPYLGESGMEQVQAMLTDADPDQRILALRVLRNVGFNFEGHGVLLGKLARDANAAVRRETAIMLHGLSGEFRTPLVVELFTRYDGSDRTYLEACGYAAEGVEARVWELLREGLLQHDPLTWTQAFARITWRLQPEAGIAGVLKRANARELSMADRKLAVDTLAFTRSKAAMDAMVQLRESEDIVISEMATAWLLIRATDEWEQFGGRQVLKDTGIYDPAHAVVTEVKMPEMPAKSNLPPVRTIMSLKGDVEKGKMVSMRCVMCHRMGDQGVDYGPDLAGWASTQGLESFIRAVVSPTDSIALGFEGDIVPLKDGREVQGILISAGDPLTVRSMGGATQLIAREMLDKRTRPMKRSLMLSADELGLTAQDIADLAAYMMTYK